MVQRGEGGISMPKNTGKISFFIIIDLLKGSGPTRCKYFTGTVTLEAGTEFMVRSTTLVRTVAVKGNRSTTVKIF